MRKTIIGMGIFALLVGTASCSKSNSYSEEDKQIGDSLSIAMGHVMGGQIKTTIDRQMQQYDGKAKLNVQKVMRGMESVLYADTADEQSYMQGVQIGLTLMQQPIKMMERDGYPYNAELIMKAFKEVFDMDSISTEQFWQEYQAIDQRSKAYARQRVINKNGEAGQAYVDSVKKANSNVMTTEDGLSYLIETEGVAPMATPADTVLVYYKGSLVDGTVFDEHMEGEPARFALSSVVKGFSEGLQLLGEGGEATLYIPGSLGYGDNGQPRAGIGPNSTLIFDVKVVKVLPAAVEESAQ